MKILKTVNLKKYYGSGEAVVKAVDNISFSVEKGSFTVIVGTSGSGKMTLLNLIGGLDHADSGGGYRRRPFDPENEGRRTDHIPSEKYRIRFSEL